MHNTSENNKIELLKKEDWVHQNMLLLEVTEKKPNVKTLILRKYFSLQLTNNHANK